MATQHEAVQQKVQEIFTELCSERARWLAPTQPSRVSALVAKALSEDREDAVAAEIGFHVTDWAANASFIVALHLFPERFTPEEIEAGVDGLMYHVPHHILAAARLGGYPRNDIFQDNQ